MSNNQDLQLVFSREELMADDDYATPNRAAGYDLHGGFDAAGTYISPRTKHRWPAVRNWQAHLAQNDQPLLDASRNLLTYGAFPNEEQHAFLISKGRGQAFWNSLTITGIIEAKGQALVDFPAPDFQEIIEEDVSATATGHLIKGLLVAHGMDEGGDPNLPGIGAHDQMWFAVRDLLFGKDAFPLVDAPESISRPIEGREIPQIPEIFEGVLLLLTDVLMIEVRAEAFFDLCLRLASRPDLYAAPAEDVQLAHDMVARIQTDEAIHVAYLQTVISEMRGFHFKTAEGPVLGAKLIDPVWERMVKWHGQTQIELSRDLVMEDMKTALADNPPLYEGFCQRAGKMAA